LLNGKLVSRTSEYIFKETRPGDYRLEVVTRDADGATARATRIVRVTNLAPVLTVSPKRNAGVEAGQILRFEATATDPEKTPVRVTYKIDGKPERRGNSYDFVRTAPGSYTVQITAQDEDGLETTETRSVDVRAGTIFPPATAAWEQGVYDALVKYETAIEAKDMSKLELVWKFNPRKNNRQLWSSRFKKTQNISITLEVDPPRQLPRDQAEVKFLLSPLLDGNPARRYMITATLLKRMNGWQIIKYARKQVPRT
jgi:hypothetical protein